MTNESSGEPHVGIHGHWTGNIGHAIMAVGVTEILHEALPSDGYTIRHIEEHAPFDLHPDWSPTRLLNRLGGSDGLRIKSFLNHPRVRRWMWRHVAHDLASLDLVLGCGGPVVSPAALEPGRGGQVPLIRQYVSGGLEYQGVPVIALSLGSAYPWEDRPDSFGPDAEAFFEQVLDSATQFTARDPLARDLLGGLGADVPLVPDTGFVAGAGLEPTREEPPDLEDGYLVVNYQRQGANTDWGQDVDTEAWRRTLRGTVEELARSHEVRFLCHDDGEVELARSLDLSHPIHRPTGMDEYAEVLEGAVGGITNRLHASIPLAGVGVPPVYVGTDTRMLTTAELGIPTYYVEGTTVEDLVDAVEDQLDRRHKEFQRLHRLRDEALETYASLVQEHV